MGEDGAGCCLIVSCLSLVLSGLCCLVGEIPELADWQCPDWDMMLSPGN